MPSPPATSWHDAFRLVGLLALGVALSVFTAALGAAEPLVDATRLTLDVTDASLAEVLAEVQRQTGNPLVDERDESGPDGKEDWITIKIDDGPFWPALDEILDAAAASPHAFSGEESLAIVEREPGALRRSGRAAYSGPFRIEVTSVHAVRGTRVPEQSRLRLELEIAWEPRLKLLALTQTAADTQVVCDDGLETPALSPDAAFDVEVQPGSHAADVNLSLQLPARRAKSLTTVSGTITALVAGRIADLAFDKLAEANDVSQDAGGVTVTVNRVVKNDQLWEVHMRVGVEELAGGVAPHRSWLFQNVACLKDPQGEEISHAGFETTMQSKSEVGFVYLYDLPQGVDIADCTWVYRTPAALALAPIEYELIDVPLP